jgi:CelD/BcsL family acetyltransferase involved in cellulose biosynthesis
MISITLAHGKESIEALAPEWDALVEDSEAAAFSGPAWCLAWIDAYQSGRIAVITARDGERLVGVLPLARISSDLRGLYFPRVSPLARGDYKPFVVDPVLAATVLPRMLDAAFEYFGRHSVYWWANIPLGHPTLHLLRTALAARGMVSVGEEETAFRLRLDGGGLATAEKTWPASHRRDIHRQRKRLGEVGPVWLWEPSTLDEAESVLAEFFRVHDEKWLSANFPGMFGDPAQRRHFEAVLRRMWGRGVHLSTVRCGSIDVSYHFGFLSGGWLLWYRPSYRVEFSGYSPGKIHVHLLVEKACQRKWKGIDFLLGEEPYKKLWSNETTAVTGIHSAFHAWGPGYLWFAQGKPFVRQRLQLQYMRFRASLQKLRAGRGR